MQVPGLAALADVARLDTMVTVVDAANFGADLDALENLRDRGWGRDEGDERPVSALLADQVEFADVLVLNKTDCVTPDQAARVEAVLRSLNPRALIRATTHANVDLDDVVGTGRFSLDAAREVCGRGLAARPHCASPSWIAPPACRCAWHRGRPCPVPSPSPRQACTRQPPPAAQSLSPVPAVAGLVAEPQGRRHPGERGVRHPGRGVPREQTVPPRQARGAALLCAVPLGVRRPCIRHQRRSQRPCIRHERRSQRA